MNIPEGTRVHTPDGPGIVRRNWEALEGDRIVDVETESRGICSYAIASLSPETFLDFCTRSTGFGHTGWRATSVIVGLCLMLILAGVFMSPDHTGAKGICYAFGSGILVLLMVVTYANYRRT